MKVKISKKYTEDFIIVRSRKYKVCDRCATINWDNKRCIKCGSTEFSPLSEYEKSLLTTKPEMRDHFS